MAGTSLEMQMRAARGRLRILELPVPHGRRLAGKSKVAGTLRGTLKSRYSDLRNICPGRLRPHRLRAPPNAAMTPSGTPNPTFKAKRLRLIKLREARLFA